MTDRTVLAEKIEALIAWLKKAEVEARETETAACEKRLWGEAQACQRKAGVLAEVADRLTAILPPPPLVIKPGRWYRTDEGRKFMPVNQFEGLWRGVAERMDGVLYTLSLSPADLIAPWEDRSDAD